MHKHGLLTLSVFGLVLTGCGDSGHSGGTALPTTTVTRSAGAMPGATTAPAATASPGPVDGEILGAGLLALACTGTGLQLQRIDLITGRVLGRRQLPEAVPGTLAPEPLLGGPGCLQVSGGLGGRPSGLFLRQRLDHDLRRVTAEHSVQPDNARHIGYIDMSNGHFTDLSAPGNSGFSAHTVGDSQGVFSPNDGQLWFITESNTFTSVDVNTGVRRTRGKAPASASFAVAAGSDLPVLAGRLPNPAGTMAVSEGNSQGLLRLFTGADMASSTAPIRYSGGGSGDCTPTTWVSSTVVLCERTGINEPPPPLLIDVTGKAKPVPALPANSRDNERFVADPKTGQIAFISTLGTAVALYRADAHRPGDQPTKVKDLEDSTSSTYITSLLSLTS